MGYRAKAHGFICLKAPVDSYSALEQLLGSTPGFDFGLADDYQTVDISFCDNYKEESWYSFYASISDKTEKAKIEFEGEDSCLWKHEFLKETSQWLEFSGRVVYEEFQPICGLEQAQGR